MFGSVAVLLPLVTGAYAQDDAGSTKPAVISAISERVRPFVDDREISALVTLVATPDRIVHLDAIGDADIARKTGRCVRTPSSGSPR